MRLLLVEDDPMIAQSVTEALKGPGHAIDWAEDGHAGDLALGNDAHNLRKKPGPEKIVTVRGIGYRLAVAT